MDVQAGDVALGRYRLGRLLGSGGMGDVYLARDLTLRRDVAVKFVTAGGRASDTLTRRLIHEARAVAALDHPSICPVYDAGVDPAGRPYMVMQYVEGETLAARLGRGPMPIREALGTCERIADALASAHRRGIVHRDLKPQNVMLTASQQPKLLDFGIAKFLPALDDIGADETTTSLTKAHALVGTPAYMSPEQIHNRPLDGRSDLFALGCILFECFTGRRAFDGRNTFEVLDQVAHVHPPAPSSLRGELDQRHDELCRRLLAKEPSDRFQSAEEVVGAIRLLLPDTSRPADTDSGRQRRRRALTRPSLRRAAVLGVLVAVIALATAGLWQFWRPRLPAAPADAQRFYQRGTDALREGAYRSAATALEEAVRLFPNYPLAYARLAEAHAEMDDDRAAAQDLLRVSERVSDSSRLPRDERLRLEGIRSLVVGNVDAAVSTYRELAAAGGNDAGAWVDFGRAQESAAQLADARASFERARTIDPQYAAAHLRLGIIDSFQGKKDQALAGFAEAERLYRASSNKEGEAEVLIRRGSLLNTVGDLGPARASLERARDTARTIENPFQIVRAELQLGSVMASEGRSSEAERIVSRAVETARVAGLETVAADGLIDLAGALMSPERLPEAEAPLRAALALAEKRGARRTAARAATQLAFVQYSRGHPAEALQTLEPALAFFEQHKYRNLELTAISIAARAHLDLDDIPKARELANRALKEAKATGDESRLAVALNNLAAQATVLGSLPEALALRESAETIHRGQRDTLLLPYDLTNRADLLINLGRFEDAAAALAEVDQGAGRKLEAYVGRQRRVAFLRALSATLSNRLALAASLIEAIPPSPSPGPTQVLAPALGRYVRAKQRHGVTRIPNGAMLKADPATVREQRFWTAATALASGDGRAAVAAASAGVEQASKIGNDELAWRIAAVGSAAARGVGDGEQARALRAVAIAARTRLRGSWGDAFRRYDQRPDLIELRRASELED